MSCVKVQYMFLRKEMNKNCPKQKAKRTEKKYDDKQHVRKQLN